MFFNPSYLQFNESSKSSKDVRHLGRSFNGIALLNPCGLFYPTMKFFYLPTMLKMIREFIVVRKIKVISSQIFNVTVCVDYLTYQDKAIFLQPDFSDLFVGKT